jgi:hypothetical protein
MEEATTTQKMAQIRAFLEGNAANGDIFATIVRVEACV